MRSKSADAQSAVNCPCEKTATVSEKSREHGIHSSTSQTTNKVHPGCTISKHTAHEDASYGCNIVTAVRNERDSRCKHRYFGSSMGENAVLESLNQKKFGNCWLLTVRLKILAIVWHCESKEYLC